MTFPLQDGRSRQSGVTVVEFALVSVMLILLLLGVIQFGLVLFTFNSAAEATRRGARLAVVSPISAALLVEAEMREVMPLNADCTMRIRYKPDSPLQCDAATCTHVQATVEDCTVQPWFFWPIAAPLVVPPFTAALPRESLGNN